MARVKVCAMAPECEAYIKAVKPTVRFAEKTYFQAATNLFVGIGKIAVLNAKNTFDNGKIAQSFATAVLDLERNEEDLSRELSFLNEAQINELKLPFSQKNIDIVNMAIFQTNLVRKKELLARVGMALEHARPLPQPEVQFSEPPLPPPSPLSSPVKLEKVKTPRLPGTMMNRIRGQKSVYPEPACRQAHFSENGCALTTADFTAQQMNIHLKEHMPYQDYVEFFVQKFDKCSETEAALILAQVNLWPLLYLYEMLPSRHHKGLEECIVSKYQGLVDNTEKSAAFQRHEFKAYLTVYFRKGDPCINGRYGSLLSVIEEAEVEQIRKARVLSDI